MTAESYSVAEASRLLGVSIPTLKTMCAGGQLACFRTPGGHLRVSAEALAAIRSNGRTRTLLSPAPSGVLQARRERVEELNLEGQELRAQQQLGRLRAEQAEETARRATEEHERQVEREARRERSRSEREQQERKFAEQQAEQRRAEWRQRFLSTVAASLPAHLSVARREQLLDALETEFVRRGVAEDAGVALVGNVVIPRLLAFWDGEDRAVRMREDAERRAVREIRWARDSTEAEKAEAVAAVHTALAVLPFGASEAEMKAVAFSAVAPILDKLHERRERQRRINEAVTEVFPYLHRLCRAGGISRQTLDDPFFRFELEGAVRRRLQSVMRDEDRCAARRLVQEVVDQELDKFGIP
ncbi:MAG: helix-turn-helix domain-containing protein [Candidatus Acidiferrales bacterium]